MLSSVRRQSLLLTAACGLFAVLTSVARAQEKPTDVIVAPVIERQLRTTHRVVGTVMPARTSIVGSAVDGRVLEYLVQAGDRVQQGQVMARLRTATLEIELAAAHAELVLREEELAELKNGSRPEDVEEAQAKSLGAKIVAENATRKLKRAQTLLEKRAVNQDEVDDLRERAEAAEQIQRAAAAALKRVEVGPRPEAIAQAEARRQLQIEQVRLIEDRLARYVITAPFDGFVAAERTQIGEWVQQGDPVAEVIQLDVVDIRANVPAEHAVGLTLASTVDVKFPELSDSAMTGVVDRIIPSADVRTRTFPVSIRVQNRLKAGRPLLMAGMLARIELPTGELTVTLVPKDALVLERSEASVWVVDSHPGDASRYTVRQVAVKMGVSDGPLIQVDAPLSDGDLLVIRGNERLKPPKDPRQPPQAVTILQRRVIDEDSPAETVSHR